MTARLLDRPTIDPDILDDLTRRDFLTGLAAAGLLASCGNGDGSATEAPAGDPTSGTVTGGASSTSERSGRVLTIEGRRDFETMVALGVVPIASGYQGDSEVPFAPWVEVDASEIDLSFQANAENLEAIAALRPDLIVGRDSNVEELRAELERIAPVLTVAGGGDWKLDLRSIGEAIGRADRAEELIASHDELLEEIRRRHAERIASTKVGTFQYGEGQIYWSAPRGFYQLSQVIDAVGGTQPDVLMAAGIDDLEGSTEMSGERLGDLAVADALIVVANVIDGVDDFAALEANPLWATLPAVQAGRVLRTDFFINYGSVFTAQRCLELVDEAYGLLA